MSSTRVVDGRKSHPLYEKYVSMKQRVFNPNNKDYKSYGGRGITICDRWLEPSPAGFWNFVTDMGPHPDGTSLDRINNDGGYEPGNVRWATGPEQMRNRRPFATTPRGAEKPGSKLRERDVRCIFALREQGRTQCSIAEEFGVSGGLVSQILSGKNWAHLGLAPKAAA